MKKYWAIFRATWQSSLEYRLELFTHMFMGIISLVILIFIWSAVFKQVPNFGGYTFSSMLTYLVMVRFLHFASRGNTARLVADEIKDGKLSIYLLKPISYLKMRFSSFWAERIVEILVRFLIIFAFLVLLPHYFKIPQINQVVSLFLFLIISLLFNFLWNFFQATFAFWVVDIRLFASTIGLTAMFLAGQLMPIDIMPKFLRSISQLLPFQYTLYFPIKIYQGSFTTGEVLRGVLILVVWLILFYFLLNHLWRKGLRKYESVGQ